MTITAPNVETTHGTLDMTELEEVWFEDAKCESPHTVTKCSGKVVWSRPPSHCGCRPRALVCQNLYNYVFGDDRPLWCERCQSLEPIQVSRRGWYRV